MKAKVGKKLIKNNSERRGHEKIQQSQEVPSERNFSRSEISSGKISKKRQKVENKVPFKKSPKLLANQPVDKHKEYKKEVDKDFKQPVVSYQLEGEEIVDGDNLGQTWSDTLNEVREWVSEEPIKQSKENQNRDVLKARTIDKEILTPDKGDRSLLLNETELHQKEPEIQDINVSIGSIHLTIEDSAEGKKVIHNPQIRQKPPQKVGNSTRLSRHYIRTR